MRHRYFQMENYKGIRKVKLDVSGHPQTRIYTLVGLNESGKTTILEAIDYFTSRINPERLMPINVQGSPVKNPHELIPIARRANFNGTISAEICYDLDVADNQKIAKFLRNQLDFELTETVRSFTIEQSLAFENSKLAKEQPSQIWSIDFGGLPIVGGKRSRRRTSIYLDGEAWEQAINFVTTLLPSVWYFPNFLFEFPDKIYLEDYTQVAERSLLHEFYRSVLQDVLASVPDIGDGATVESHILERAKASSDADRQALESTLLHIGQNITFNVSQSWNRIFNKSELSGTEITVTHGKDDIGWFLQVRLKDTTGVYRISERSLGFRWFFAFLLMTHYRGLRRNASNNVLFLLDEPASNLHSSAQIRLLESFSRFPENCSIVYTTHSHHLINPDWLDGTFVVKNEGLDYEATKDEFTAKHTIITLDKYRNFVVRHPNQTTYFQPVLDVLDYAPSKLENVPDVVMLEGKNDFYTLKYIHDVILERSQQLNLLPGTGSGSLDNVIRLYLAWSRNFIILLDSDEEGRKQKVRYSNIFGRQLEGRVFSFEDIDSTWSQGALERIFGADELKSIQVAAYPDAVKYNKTHFNRAVQELHIKNQQVPLSDDTRSKFTKIFEFCEEHLAF